MQIIVDDLHADVLRIGIRPILGIVADDDGGHSDTHKAVAVNTHLDTAIGHQDAVAAEITEDAIGDGEAAHARGQNGGVL